METARAGAKDDERRLGNGHEAGVALAVKDVVRARRDVGAVGLPHADGTLADALDVERLLVHVGVEVDGLGAGARLGSSRSSSERPGANRASASSRSAASTLSASSQATSPVHSRSITSASAASRSLVGSMYSPRPSSARRSARRMKRGKRHPAPGGDAQEVGHLVTERMRRRRRHEVIDPQPSVRLRFQGAQHLVGRHARRPARTSCPPDR